MCAACAKGKANEHCSHLLKVDMLISATSFDDIDPDTAPSNHIPNIPHIPEDVPIVPNVPPDPPACCPHQPKPPSLPHEPSTHNINPLIEVTPHKFQKAKPNSVPFPTSELDANVEPNADPGELT